MRVHDVFRHRKDGIVSHSNLPLGFDNHVASQGGMRSHLRQFLWGQRTGLVEDVIGNADLSNVVQRRER